MKILTALFLLIAVSAFGANPDYRVFRGAGGITVTTNPPQGLIVIDGSGVVATGTNSSIGVSTNGTSVSMAATNINIVGGTNILISATNIGSTAHIGIHATTPAADTFSIRADGTSISQVATQLNVVGGPNISILPTNNPSGSVSLGVALNNPILLPGGMELGSWSGTEVGFSNPATASLSFYILDPGSGDDWAVTGRFQVGSLPGSGDYIASDGNGLFFSTNAPGGSALTNIVDVTSGVHISGTIFQNTNGSTALTMLSTNSAGTNALWTSSALSLFNYSTAIGGTLTVGNLAGKHLTYGSSANTFDIYNNSGVTRFTIAGTSGDTATAGSMSVTGFVNAVNDVRMFGTNRLAWSNGVFFALPPDGITNNALYFGSTNGTYPALVWRTATDDAFNGVGIQPNPDFSTVLDVITTYSGTSLGQLRMYGIRLTNGAALGKVWTSTGTDGAGGWSNAVAGAGSLSVPAFSVLSTTNGTDFYGNTNFQYFPYESIGQPSESGNHLLINDDVVGGTSTNMMNAFGFGSYSDNSAYFIAKNQRLWEHTTNGNLVPFREAGSSSNRNDIGSFTRPIRTNYFQSMQMSPNARNNRTMRSDDSGVGSWSPNPAGGNGNTAGAVAARGGIQFAETNGVDGMMLDSTNKFFYDRTNYQVIVSGVGDDLMKYSSSSIIQYGEFTDMTFGVFGGTNWALRNTTAAFGPNASNTADIASWSLPVRTNYANQFEAKVGMTVGTGNGILGFGTNFYFEGALSTPTASVLRTPTNANSGVMVALPVSGITNQAVMVPLTAGQYVTYNGTAYVASNLPSAGGGGTPGGAVNMLQFHDTGAVFSGTTNMIWNSTNKMLVFNPPIGGTNVIEVRGSNANMAIGPNGGVHIGGLTAVGGSNLVVEGSVTVNQGGTNSLGPTTFTGAVNARTNIGTIDVTTNLFVLGTRYTNSRRVFIAGSVTLNAAAAGTASVSLYVEHVGVCTNSVSVSAGPLASLITVEQLSLIAGPGEPFYFVDETSGAGASVAFVPDKCSVTGL